MCEIFKKIGFVKLFAAVLSYSLISTVLHQVEVFWTLKYYMMPQYFGVWSKLMMPKAGPPEASFYIASATVTVLSGIVLVGFYYFIKNLLPKGFWKRAASFTCIVSTLALFQFYTLMWLMINLPVGLLLDWFLTGAVVLFLSSLVFAKLIKE